MTAESEHVEYDAERLDFEGLEETYVDDDAVALWHGDRGSLDAHQRDTLVAILKKEFISSDDKVEWRTLMKDPGPIETNLNNMYFTLVLDPIAEVAYKKPLRSPEQDVRTLVVDKTNTREETLVLVYLRERFRADTAAGEQHVFVDYNSIQSYVARFRPPTATDEYADTARVDRAINSVRGSGLITEIRGDQGRYRVHRAIEPLLPLSTLQLLVAALKEQNVDISPATVSRSGRRAASIPLADEDLIHLDGDAQAFIDKEEK